MNNYLVKDLMVPISEYATVRIGTTLIDAVRALEKAQEAYTTSKYQHRAILVLDDEDRVVGKVGQLRALKAIDRQFDCSEEIEEVRKFQFSDSYVAELRDHYRKEGQVMTTETLQRVARQKVEEFMQKPTPGEFVAEDAGLDTAIHKLVVGTHLSLLVTRQKKIVGILRIADVFAAVFHEMETIEPK
jgi:CBS domain-containing protein